MSQSPDQRGRVRADYAGAWAALSAMVAGGRSFGGGERNCAFVNKSGKKFANVSAVLQLDHPEDSRAVLNTDWNFDGWPDLWIANRTGPRLRCMVNGLPRTGVQGGFLALRLTGQSGNRDAVGSRVVIRDGHGVQTKIVRAGSGFLSQSSRWLHFGLGRSDRVESVVVYWAGGGKQVLGPVESNGFYELREGESARVWTPPAMHLPSKAAGSQTVASNESVVWLAMRLPLPATTWIRQGSDSPEPLRETIGKPWVLSLWSSTCLPCQREWNDWKTAVRQIEQSGLRVRLVSVDALGKPERRNGLPRDLDTPFEGGYATPELIDGLELFQRSQMEMQIPLPVPCAFLIDSNGRVAAIFKGELSVKNLLDATERLQASQGVPYRDQAVPFAGRWISSSPLPDPTIVARVMVRADRVDLARQYLNQFQNHHALYFRGDNISSTDRGRVLAVANDFLKQLETGTDSQTGRFKGRADRIRTLEELVDRSGTVETRRELAWLYLEPGLAHRDPERGFDLARKACQLDGYRDPVSLLLLAYAYGVDDDFEKAAEMALLAHEKTLDQPRRAPLFKTALDQFRDEELPDLPRSLFVPEK